MSMSTYIHIHSIQAYWSNSLTEDRQTTELANTWQYNPCLSHQINVEQVEPASNKVISISALRLHLFNVA